MFDFVLVNQTEIPTETFDQNVEWRLLPRRRAEPCQSGVFDGYVIEKLEFVLLRSLRRILLVFFIRLLERSPAREENFERCLSCRGFGLLLTRPVASSVLYLR